VAGALSKQGGKMTLEEFVDAYNQCTDLSETRSPEELLEEYGILFDFTDKGEEHRLTQILIGNGLDPVSFRFGMIIMAHFHREGFMRINEKSPEART
jgi:hypothetical protein